MCGPRRAPRRREARCGDSRVRCTGPSRSRHSHSCSSSIHLSPCPHTPLTATNSTIMVLADSPTSSSSTERALRDAEEGRLASCAAAPGPIPPAPSLLLSPTSMRSAVPGPESVPDEPAQSPQRLRAPSRSGAFGDRPHRTLSEKAKGKQRASSEPQPSGGLFPNLVQSPVDEDGPSSPIKTSSKTKRRTGRAVTIIFSGEEDGTSEGNLDIWVEDGESIGSVKDQVGLVWSCGKAWAHDRFGCFARRPGTSLCGSSIPAGC